MEYRREKGKKNWFFFSKFQLSRSLHQWKVDKKGGGGLEETTSLSTKDFDFQ